jgi:RimJ/RimL family protein N-acetyltransferase
MRIFLETDRITMRDFTPDDVEALVELDRDPEVMRYITGGEPTPRATIEREVLPRFLAFHEAGDGLGFWAALDRRDHRFLGWFHLRPESSDPNDIGLGYRLHRRAWGRGLATEGSRALLAHGFETLGLSDIVANAMPDNAASIRIMEKLGMTFDERHTHAGGIELVRYRITRAVWAALQPDA